MAELETRVDKLEDRVTNIEIQVTALSTKIDSFMQDMRDRDNQRAAEVRALDAKLTAMQAATDAKIAKIESKLDSVSKYIMGMAITTILGVGAMAAAVVGVVYSVMSKGG